MTVEIFLFFFAGVYHLSFDTNLSLKNCTRGLKGEENTGCLHLHGLLMTYGFIFLQGEGTEIALLIKKPNIIL